jgi:NADPH:quinone reductase-like Zn-dependent oxidoreductase
VASISVSAAAPTVAATTMGSAIAPFSGLRVRSLVLKGGARSCRRLGELVAQGVLKPHVARRITMSEVADAQRRMETGHGRGKIVVTPHEVPA